MGDPFGSPRDLSQPFVAWWDGECAEGCSIDAGDWVGYFGGELMCERCYWETRGT